jgi:2-oxoglutarate ferredoxin oxidoreductase subunit beta
MADISKYNVPDVDVAWCPGCGNFQILPTVKETLAELSIEPEEAAWVSGIGQAAKIPQYFKVNYFNGLHGRSLPVATAIKAANPNLVVVAESGDGCSYGEGGNHFIHNIRRNPDITNIVHDNRIYGLTKGQASPTTAREIETPIQVNGVFLEPFNPIAVAIASRASFVARAYSGDKGKTKAILKKAIEHNGYALVDLLHPCVSFNKVNTYKWYKENTYYLEDDYDPNDQEKAFKISQEMDKLALGIIYKNNDKAPFEESLPPYQENKTPLFRKDQKLDVLKEIIEKKRKE